jgi:hypothetical protein
MLVAVLVQQHHSAAPPGPPSISGPSPCTGALAAHDLDVERVTPEQRLQEGHKKHTHNRVGSDAASQTLSKT